MKGDRTIQSRAFIYPPKKCVKDDYLMLSFPDCGLIGHCLFRVPPFPVFWRLRSIDSDLHNKNSRVANNGRKYCERGNSKQVKMRVTFLFPFTLFFSSAYWKQWYLGRSVYMYIHSLEWSTYKFSFQTGFLESQSKKFALYKIELKNLKKKNYTPLSFQFPSKPEEKKKILGYCIYKKGELIQTVLWSI